MNKTSFIRRLEKRISARSHMTLICLATIAAGIVASKGILYFGLLSPALRYGSAVAISYAVFFLSVYIWLRLHFSRPQTVSESTSLDSLDVPDFGALSPIPSTSPAQWSGAGGNFSGGGASASWGNTPAEDETFRVGASDAVDGALSLDEGIVFVLLGIVLAAIFGSATYIIYQAPEILFEAAFEMVLATSLLKKTRQLQSEGWQVSIFKRTWWIFAIVLFLAMSFGLMIKFQCPQASSFSEYRSLCLETKTKE